MNGALITQVDVPMEEKGRPVKVRVITFTNKPQMPPNPRPQPQPKPNKPPIESLPQFTYNRATDKGVGKDSTAESL